MIRRKRVVSSCIPCYTRKQKCNRQYPCNNCSRRRCPEECAYFSTNAARAPSPPTPSSQRRERNQNEKERTASTRLSNQRSDWNAQLAPLAVSSSSSSFAELFGYFEDSDSNTLALIRKLGLGEDDSGNGKSPGVPPEAAEKVHRIVGGMPGRQILDFLIQYFVAEVNWMDQLVHPSWFVAKYHQWWMIEKVTLVVEVDFAVLILRICSYASQFLPSPGYMLDKIHGVMFADIRNTCDETADSLAHISQALDSQGSLIRVQHLAFFGLRCQMEGRRTEFWESLSRAIRVAQTIGLHSEAARSRSGKTEVDKEMERRTYCNLYIWDSSLSHRLDRIPILPSSLGVGNWPQMQLGSSSLSDSSSSEESWGDVSSGSFIERVLQARLAEFWRSVKPMQDQEFDMIVAEERYDEFCREYIAKLPPAFALYPDGTWDKKTPKLQRQRQLLHVAIFDVLCWNFRPLLIQPPQDKNMPSYKRVLVGAQKKSLAVAAMYSLQAVAELHAMLGGRHTRFAGLIFSTFEAAVLLLYLCADPQFPSECPGGFKLCMIDPKIDPLRAGMSKISRPNCISAVHGALNRLRMLAEVSPAAELGASTLTQLMSKMYETGSPAMNGTEIKDVTTSANQRLVVATSTATGPLYTTAAVTSARSDGSNATSFSVVDPRSLDSSICMNPSSSISQMTSWPSLYPSSLQPGEDFMSMSATPDLHGSRSTPIIDFTL